MRLTAVIALFLLALCAPAPRPRRHVRRALRRRRRPCSPRAGRREPTRLPCAASRARHGVPERRDARAPTAAASTSSTRPRQRRSSPSTTTLSYVKASAATALCAVLVRRAARRHAAPLQRRARSRTPSRRAAPTGSSSASTTRAARRSRSRRPRANNVVFAGGWVTLSDPTPPALSASGPTGVQSGLSAELQWAASDPESGAPAVTYAIDGGARVALRGQACSWLCGTGDDRHCGDRPRRARRRAAFAHRLRAVVRRRRCQRRTAALHASTARPPAQAADPGRARCRSRTLTGWWGHAPDRARRSPRPPRRTSSPRPCASTAPPGALVFQHDLAGALRRSCGARRALWARTAPTSRVLECDGAGHCSASTSAALPLGRRAAAGLGRRLRRAARPASPRATART